MKPAELNYPVHEKEALSIVHHLKHWRHYLCGSPVTIVETDHKSLERLVHLTEFDTYGRLGRWQQTLCNHTIKVKYVPGVQNVVADFLSRPPRPAEQPQPQLMALRATPPGEGTPGALLAKIKALLPIHPTTEPLVKMAQGSEQLHRGWQPVGSLQWQDGLLYAVAGDGSSRLVVPTDPSVTHPLLHEAHDTITSGHLGRDKTLDKLRRLYVWKGMSSDVEEYVATCPTCQAAKPCNLRPAGLLRSLPVPTDRWQVVSMDFILALPVSKAGNDSIWTIVDKLSKRATFIPVKSTYRADKLADLFIAHIFRLHGMPEAIVSDRDAKFTGGFWRALMKALGTNLNMSTPFHPQTDGQSEAANKTIEQLLRTVINPRQTNWEESLPLLEFAYNDSLSASTGFTPFYLDTGRHPRIPLMLGNPRAASLQAAGGGLHSVAYLLTTCQRTLREAREHLAQAANRQAVQANKRRRAPDFAVGDQVMLSSGHLNLQYTTAGKNSKLAQKHIGPFTITRIVGTNAAELDLSAYPRCKFHNVQNMSYLTHFQTSDVYTGRPIPPPPLYIDEEGHNQWEVDEIVGKRGKGGNIKYLVKYKGYPMLDAQWRSSKELVETAWDSIQEFEGTLHCITDDSCAASQVIAADAYFDLESLD
jgi:hypothetical protein